MLLTISQHFCGPEIHQYVQDNEFNESVQVDHVITMSQLSGCSEHQHWVQKLDF